MLAELGSNQPLGRLREAKSLADVLMRAKDHCKDCKVTSPIVCMERCDVWRVKHEIHETEKIVSQTDHERLLFNALKNRRRLKNLEVLCQRSSSLKELQRALRESGFSHSRRTIVEAYLTPMLKAGLVKEEGGGFKVTFYGRKVHELLAGLSFGSDPLSLLPFHSCCYEETVLKELAKPRTFNELATRVPKKSLSRILMRLRVKGLLVKSPRSDYVYYHCIKGKPRVKLSPTEKRVFEAIPQAGIPIRQLYQVVGINLRRTYKYLRRLREKKLVFAIKISRTYELTAVGREIVNRLNEIENLAASTLNAPAPLAQVKP